MPWSYWAILGIILIMAEVFTGGFGIIWFGISALCAVFASYVGVGWQVQMLVFVAAGLVLLFATRPLTRRFREGPDVRFGVKALMGKQGVVIQAIGEPASPVGQDTICRLT